jgi:hypothetical protein
MCNIIEVKKMKPLNILGLIIFAASALVLIGFALFKFLEAPDMPLVVRWGIIGLVLGAIIILASLIMERIKDKKGE